MCRLMDWRDGTWNIRIIIETYFIGIEHWQPGRHWPKFNANKLFSIGRKGKKRNHFFDTQRFWTCICVTWLWGKWTLSQHLYRMLKWWFVDSCRTAIDWLKLNVSIERNENETNCEHWKHCGKLIRFTFDKSNRILSVSLPYRFTIKIRKIPKDTELIWNWNDFERMANVEVKKKNWTSSNVKRGKLNGKCCSISVAACHPIVFKMNENRDSHRKSKTRRLQFETSNGKSVHRIDVMLLPSNAYVEHNRILNSKFQH